MEKKFRFKLENVLDLKKLKRDLLFQDLSKLLKDLMAEEEQLESLIKEFESSKNKLIDDLLCGGNKSTKFFYRDYLNYLDSGITEKKKIISAIEEVILKKRKEIKKAEKEKRAIEKLKDKRIKEFDSEKNKKIQKDMDEISLQRFSLNYGGTQ